MNKILSVGVAALAFTLSAPVQAAAIVNGDNSITFNNAVGSNSAVINFNGLGGDPKVVVPGLSAQLTLTLTSIVGNTFNFGYSLLNNSSLAGTRVSGIGFNVDPNVSSVSSTGIYDEASLGGFTASFTSEVCFNGGPGNCPESNPANSVAFGATGNGTLALTFGSAQTSITLSNFLDRYQGFSTSVQGQTPLVTSAVGQGTPVRGGGVEPTVPEPATWAMMILGFGVIGGAIRRQRRQAVRYSFA